MCYLMEHLIEECKYCKREYICYDKFMGEFLCPFCIKEFGWMLYTYPKKKG